MVATPEIELLDGTNVVEIGGEPVQAAGRLLAELGATVTVVEPRYLDHLREKGWGHGKAVASADELPSLLAGTDVVLYTPFEDGVPVVERWAAPQAVWVEWAARLWNCFASATCPSAPWFVATTNVPLRCEPSEPRS